MHDLRIGSTSYSPLVQYKRLPVVRAARSPCSIFKAAGACRALFAPASTVPYVASYSYRRLAKDARRAVLLRVFDDSTFSRVEAADFACVRWARAAAYPLARAAFSVAFFGLSDRMAPRAQNELADMAA